MNELKEYVITREPKIDITVHYIEGTITKDYIETELREIIQGIEGNANIAHVVVHDVTGPSDPETVVEFEFVPCNVPFDRIRRITGYLVGTLDRFNNAKKAEESERVKHNLTSSKNEISDETKRFRDYVDKVREEQGFKKIDWDKVK